MNAIAQLLSSSTLKGTCTGTIKDDEPFKATYVEIVQGEYPEPIGTARVMLAIQRAPDYSTKELKLYFSEDLENGSYSVPDPKLGVLFVDASDPDNPTLHNAVSGAVLIDLNAAGVLTGSLSVRVEDEDTSFSIKADFTAEPDVGRRHSKNR